MAVLSSVCQIWSEISRSQALSVKHFLWQMPCLGPHDESFLAALLQRAEWPIESPCRRCCRYHRRSHECCPQPSVWPPTRQWNAALDAASMQVSALVSAQNECGETESPCIGSVHLGNTNQRKPSVMFTACMFSTHNHTRLQLYARNRGRRLGGSVPGPMIQENLFNHHAVCSKKRPWAKVGKDELDWLLCLGTPEETFGSVTACRLQKWTHTRPQLAGWAGAVSWTFARRGLRMLMCILRVLWSLRRFASFGRPLLTNVQETAHWSLLTRRLLFFCSQNEKNAKYFQGAELGVWAHMVKRSQFSFGTAPSW